MIAFGIIRQKTKNPFQVSRHGKRLHLRRLFQISFSLEKVELLVEGVQSFRFGVELRTDQVFDRSDLGGDDLARVQLDF